MAETNIDYKERYENAVELLRAVLTESGIENDFDENIYDFLKENDELPDDYTPYWLDDNED
jgi:hypothetical protein